METHSESNNMLPVFTLFGPIFKIIEIKEQKVPWTVQSFIYDYQELPD